MDTFSKRELDWALSRVSPELTTHERAVMIREIHSGVVHPSGLSRESKEACQLLGIRKTRAAIAKFLEGIWEGGNSITFTSAGRPTLITGRTIYHRFKGWSRPLRMVVVSPGEVYEWRSGQIFCRVDAANGETPTEAIRKTIERHGQARVDSALRNGHATPANGGGAEWLVS